MRLPDIIRSTTFRWTLGIAGAFAVCTVLLFGFVYWQTAAYITMRIDRVIAIERDLAADASPKQRQLAIEARLSADPRRIKLGGLFDAEGRPILGNLARLPPGLASDGAARSIVVERVDQAGREQQTVRAVARHLATGETLVIGRAVDEIEEVREIVGSALAFGLLPALCLALGAGALLSSRARKRIDAVDRAVRRIIAGDVRERLPTRGIDEPFDNLTRSVNRMLDEITGLLEEISGVGDDIAHDLRTPLTRVRVSLERGRNNSRTIEALQAVVDHAVLGLDQSLSIITALLRIAEIEHGRRLAGFGAVELGGLVREVGDLYEPIAEDKKIVLQVTVEPVPPIQGDRDLLFEAVANLVDNAVKFTPEGGEVRIALASYDGRVGVRVSDSGPGIGEAERAAVLKRFYRSDKSRHTPGIGLGLSLVAAIAKLHSFGLSIGGGPGCVVELICWRPAEGP